MESVRDALLTAGAKNVIAAARHLKALTALKGQASRQILRDLVGLRSQALLVGSIDSRF
jgi:hypothetical protein